MSPPGPPGARPPTRRGLPLLALALVVVVVAFVLVARAGRDGGEGQADAPVAGDGTTVPAGSTPAPAAGTAPPPRRATTTTTRSSAGVPTDWVRYTDAATGYRVAHPPGWEVQRLDRTRTDFRDPETGAYLRVDWTDRPGDSPVAAWEQQSAGFGARHQGYRELRIEPTTYKGFDAAVWEYTYEASTRLHAVNLGFVTGTHGFALNFQTPERIWEDSQPLFEAFKAGFEPPG